MSVDLVKRCDAKLQRDETQLRVESINNKVVLNMKKTILAIILAGLTGTAFATGPSVSASSSALVGSGSVTGNVGNGFATQGSAVGATNTSTATAFKLGPTVVSSASSVGGTTSTSYGLAFRAFGATGGFAVQGGAASASAH